MVGAQAFGQGTDNLMIGSTQWWGLNDLRAQGDVLLAASLVDIVMLQEHRCREHDISHLRRLRHELFMYADKQILPGKALMNPIEIWRN